MSKKHYEAFAAELKAARPSLMEYANSKNWQIAWNKWNEIVLMVAGLFAEDNPKFNSERFMNAVNSD